MILLLSAFTIGGAAGGFFVRKQLSVSDFRAIVPALRELLAGAQEETAEAVAADAPADETVYDSPDQPDLPESVAAALKSGISEEIVSDATGTQAAANAILHGDLLLQEGRVSEAVRRYRHLLDEAAADATVNRVRYRLALCAEALGHHEEAFSAYQEVITTAPADLLKELAWLGQVRVLVARHEIPSAQQLLRRWILQDNEAFAGSVPVAQEALYLLGVISATAALEGQGIPLWEDDGLAQPRFAFEPSRYLPAVFTADTRKPVEIPAGVQMLHQLQESVPGSTYFQGRLARASITRVLQLVCETPAWQLEISQPAETTIRAHTVRIDFSEQSADLLFDLLLAPLGLSWTFEKGVLHVVADSELTPEDRAKYQRSLGERTLYAALLSLPEHELTPTAYLLLGNLSFREHELPTARRHFEHILQNYPRSSVDAETWFNAAKVALAEGDLDRAQQALLGSVDAGRGHPMEPVALLLSGRHYLLLNEPTHAVRPLVRGATLAANEDVRAMSLLTLASAHLMAGRPEGANVALMEDRRLLQTDAYRDRSALLASLSRFRAASTSEKRDRDGRSLIASLSHVGPSQWSNLHDQLLTAEAYQEVGLAEMAHPILESAIERAVPSPLRTRMQFQLADLLVERGDASRAQILLASMIEGSSPQVSSQAMLVLADLHGRHQETDRAEQICLDLLRQSLSETQRIKALRLLGGIYAGRGDRQRAVLCYSGVSPQLLESAGWLPPEAAAADMPAPGDSFPLSRTLNREVSR